jgi:hypothetical protein
VECAATDASGNTATGSFTVTVQGAAAQLTDQLALVGSTGGGSFADQLENVLASLTAGNETAACGSLGAYAHHLHAQAGKQFSSSQATTLIANATRIEAVIGC